jgi:hypothetical protein
MRILERLSRARQVASSPPYAARLTTSSICSLALAEAYLESRAMRAVLLLTHLESCPSFQTSPSTSKH